MNSKRRAELQRRLSMSAVPTPPAGLSQRIKDDIPKYLQAEPERERFSRSVAFSMRIAASILLLITSVFVTLNLLEPESRQVASRPVAVAMEPAVMRDTTLRTDAATATTASAPAEEIRLEVSEEIPMPTRSVVQAQPLQPINGFDSNTREARFDEQKLARDNDDGWRRGEAFSVTAEAPAVSFSSEVAAVPPPPAPPPAEGRMAVAARASAPMPSTSILPEAIAADLELDAKKNLFGITVDPQVFHRIKSTLESGAHPEDSAVNVEALVNYFAGEPSRPVRKGIRLQVEASPAVIAAEGDHAVLRFTIDTPSVEKEEGASTPPVARDARVEIEFDPVAVMSSHRVGENTPIAPEPVLLYNSSVTALYDLELRPRLKSTQRVATVRFQYRSVTDGNTRTETRVIRARDLTKSWTEASRRHRLASLGAIWGESLKGSWKGIELARRAEELVTQNPKDPLARELKDLVDASGGGGR